MPTTAPTVPPSTPPKADPFSPTPTGIGRFIILIGPPFAGKTTAALTFPNPRVMNLDNKLPAGTLSVPFHDPAFCDRLAPRAGPYLPPNRRDAIINWLLQNVGKLPEDITLILDSMSAVDDAFHLQSERIEDIAVAASGKRDNRQLFGAKLGYLGNVFALLKIAKCRVIVTCHSQPEYNEKGDPTGAVKPFVTGSFSDKIAGYATDIFGAYVDVDPTTGKPKVDPVTKEIIGYRWQLKPDRTCPLTNTSLILPPGVTNIRARWADLEALINS